MTDAHDLFTDGNVQRLFTSNEGLPATATTAIAQTSDGFMWFGSYEGLARYDGKVFERIEEGRLSNITSLLGTKDGALWIGSSDTGLWVYRDGELKQLPFEDSKGGVQCLSETGTGNLLFGNAEGVGLFHTDDYTAEMFPEEKLKGSFIQRIYCDGEPACMIVTRKGDLFVCDRGSCEQVDLGEANGSVRCVYHDEKNETYLIGTTDNLLIYCDENLQVREIRELSDLECINDIYTSPEGELWLCADNGIAIYQEGNSKRRKLQLDNSVDNMFVDQEGNYWFISSRLGVFEISRSRFCDVSQTAGIDSIVVNAIWYQDGRLYVGHDNGIIVLDESSLEVVQDDISERMNQVRVRCIYADPDDTLWIATKGLGLVSHTKDGVWRAHTSASDPLLASNNVRCIIPTEGGLLFGTDAGAYTLIDDEVKPILNDPDDISSRVLSLAEGGGKTYLGMDGYGLYVVENGEIRAHYSRDNGLTSDVVMKIYKSTGLEGFWLVTGNSLMFLYEDGHTQKVENLPSSNIFDFLPLQDENVLILTGSGIYRAKEADLLSENGFSYICYSHVDGLPYEITANSYQCIMDKTLYLCGAGGIASMNQEEGFAGDDRYNLLIDRIRCDNAVQYVNSKENVAVSADTHRIVIDAHVMTFRSENPFVYYYLEGFDDDQTISQLNNFGPVSYTNLNGGTYRFHFGILDHETGESVQEISVQIIKLYRWYELWYCKLLIALAIAGILAFMVAKYIIARTKRDNERIRMQYEMQEKQHLEEVAYKDYLTGVYNRNYLTKWLDVILPGSSYPVTFISIDCNNLKTINDTYGHQQGDKMLTDMVGLLKHHFIGPEYTIFRTGGDEFMILCCGVESEKAGQTMERIREEAAGLLTEGIPLTFGYGICTQGEEDFDLDEGMRLSDMEMLRDKDQFHGRRK